MIIGQNKYEDLLDMCECADSFIWKNTYSSLEYPKEIPILVKDIQRYTSFNIHDIHNFCKDMGVLNRSFTDHKGQAWIVLNTIDMVKWFKTKTNHEILDVKDNFSSFVFILNSMFIRRFAKEGSYRKGLPHLLDLTSFYDIDIHNTILSILRYREKHYNDRVSVDETTLMKQIGMI